MMKEARDDAALQTRMAKEALRTQEEAKIRKGQELVILANERVPHRDDSAVESGDENEDEDARPKKRLDNVRQLLLEQKRYERKMQEREKESVTCAEKVDKDHYTRKEEREAHERMELEKFNPMPEVLRSQRNQRSC